VARKRGGMSYSNELPRAVCLKLQSTSCILGKVRQLPQAGDASLRMAPRRRYPAYSPPRLLLSQSAESATGSADSSMHCPLDSSDDSPTLSTALKIFAEEQVFQLSLLILELEAEKVDCANTSSAVSRNGGVVIVCNSSSPR
jgi:hypothetical protein